MNRIPHTQGLLVSALSAVALTFGASLYPQAGVADWQVEGPANEDLQNIVIVVSENPRSNPERTCLAVTLAKTFAKNPYRPQNVTIFATLDGAALGVERVVDKPRFKCAQADGSEISLQENLEQFLSEYDENLGRVVLNHDHLVLCPICYHERFGDRLPDYGVLPSVDYDDDNPDEGLAPQTAVIDVLANADKVIDF
jgi:predicted peroxiredoxin